MSVRVPRYVVEYFLSGKTHPGALERFTQNGGIVSEVWLEFAKDLTRPVRVLIAPVEGVSAVDVGYVLHTCITQYRAGNDAKAPGYPSTRNKLSVSPLENFVAVTLYLDELLRVVLPLTRWWSERSIARLNQKWNKSGTALQQVLSNEIKLRLKQEGERPVASAARPTTRSRMRDTERKIREAAPIAALIGVFLAAQSDPETAALIPAEPSKDRPVEQSLWDYAWDYAEVIAERAVNELSREIPDCVFNPNLSVPSEQAAKASDPDRRDPPALIDRVFLDRQVGLAVTHGVSTIKADAANRVFGLSCENLTWGIIDSGIDASHPAFKQHDPDSRSETRIKFTLDFTPIEQIRNFDLTEHPAGSEERERAIKNVIGQLRHLPDYPALDGARFETVAFENLRLIAEQLERRLQPDWNLIEPLIQRRSRKEGEPEPEQTLVSPHGTHVAGILAADWREPRAKKSEGEEVILKGVCPDLNLYDLRVIDPSADAKSTEFAVLAALEYVQFANRRTTGMKQVIHGVNISLSIPHEVRSYACGSTPICIACNNLVGAGVVVVAAAGNRGWNEQEMGFGSFSFCTITDPGNAEDVITVGATHPLKPHTYGVSFFSSRGPTGDGRIKPDLVAPGEKIKGPVLDRSDDELDGTSMAAPFVSGAAALLLARNNELLGNPRRIKQILCETATDLGREKYFQGHGLVDVLRAMQKV